MVMELSSTLASIEAMVRQEGLAYHPPTRDEAPTAERFTRVGVESRGQMLTFYYDLVEKIGGSRETPEIAISYLDRFLASPVLGPQALRNKKFFQLASTACLYTAVKMHELQAITPSLLADLSHGVFTAKEVEEMELVLAQTLRWRLNPPTSLAFVRFYLDLVPPKLLTPDLKKVAYDLAKYQTEYALADKRLFTERKSVVAFWAVENALKQLHMYVNLSDYVGSIGVAPQSSFGGLQAVLRMALTSKLGLVVVAPPYSTIRPIPPATTSTMLPASTSTSTTTLAPARKSWFSCGQRTLSPRSQYHISPRSVGNNVA